MRKYSREMLQELYEKHGSLAGVGRELGITKQSVWNWFNKYEIERYSCAEVGVRKSRKYQYEDDYFENIDTEEKAYWLGFIMADGCILKKLAVIG